jgi:PAS domain S-box-containing protein
MNLTPRILFLSQNLGDIEAWIFQIRLAGIRPWTHQVHNELDLYRLSDPLPDLLIIDRDYPDLDICRLLGILNEKNLDLPLILMADQIGKYEIECLRIGMDDYVEKDRINRLGLTVERIIKSHQSSQELRINEKRYRVIFEDSPIALWELDLSDLYIHLDSLRLIEGDDLTEYLTNHPEAIVAGIQGIKQTNANRAALQLAGVESNDDLINLPKVFDIRTFQAFWKSIIDLEIGKSAFAVETVLQRMDGSFIDVMLNWSVPNANGSKPTRVLVSVIDISEQKKANQSLRVSEERYRKLVELSPDAIYIQSQGKYVFINDSGLKLFGAERPDQIIGKQVLDFVHPDFRMVVEERTQVLNQARRNVPRIEEKLLQVDGTPIDVDVVASPFTYDGQPGSIVIAHDITQRKRDQEALRLSEEHYRRLVEIAHDAILICTTDKIQFINPAGLILLGATDLCEVANKSIFDIFDISTHPRLNELLTMDGAVDNVTPFVEGIINRLDGKILNVEIVSSKFNNEGGNSIQLILHDLTRRKQMAEALFESEKRYRVLFDESPVPTLEEDFSEVKKEISKVCGSNTDYSSHFISHPEDILRCLSMTKILDANRSAVETFRATSKEELITNFSKIVGTQCGDFHRKSLLAIAEGRHEFETSLTNYTLDGQEIFIVLKWIVVSGYEETYGRVLVSTTDITGRKRAEEALEREQRLMQTLMDTIPDTIYFKDNQSRFIRVNRAWADRLHLEDPSSVIGKTDFDFFTEEHAQTAFEDEQKITQSGMAVINLEEKETYPDRLPTWVSTTKMPLTDETGKIIGTFGVSRDITERKRAEEALIQHHEHLEELVKERTAKLIESEADIRKHSEEISDLYNNAPCGYHSLDADGTILRINDTELKWLGYSREEIVGKKKLIDLLTIEGRNGFSREFPLFKKRGYAQNIEIELVRKDGTVLPVLLNSTALTDKDGNFIMSRETLVDHTEPKRAEKALLESKDAAESANRAKSAFLANMSHEIRTPMNAILGFTQLMLRDFTISNQQKQYLETIQRSGEHLLGLINDVLEMSKIEADRITINPSTFDLLDLVKELESIFKVRTDAKDLQFLVEIEDRLQCHILADENKLRQVFTNLLGNAVKFTTKGGICWRIMIKKDDLGKLHLISEVEDTGPGIAPDEMKNLFKPFGQTSVGEKTGGGTGLGLVIGRKIAQLMGGDISVVSEEGKGSIFRVNVEIDKGNGEDIRKADAVRRVKCVKPGQELYRILIADDHQENRLLLAEMLKNVGLITKEAVNGEEVLSLYNEWKPHLILMDMRMPVMDGFEAVKRIRAIEAGSRIPIIAVTASAFIDERTKILASGVDGYIRKPFTEQELFEGLENYLHVQFEYEKENHLGPSTIPEDVGGDPAFSLLDLSEGWISQIQEAVVTANMDRLMEIADQIAVKHPQIASGLREIANNYQYDLLLNLIKEKRALPR